MIPPCPKGDCSCAGRKRKPTFPDGSWVRVANGWRNFGPEPQQVLRSYFNNNPEPLNEIAVLSGPHPKEHSGFYYVSHLEPAPEPMPAPIGLPRKR